MPDSAATTRDRLLKAARELFTSRGFHGTTTPLLARTAGVAEGTIYRHFASKDALLNAAFRLEHETALAEIREIGDIPGLSTGSRLTSLAKRWLTAADGEPSRMLLLLAWRERQLLDDGSIQAAAAFRSGVERILAGGKQEGTVRAGGVELWTSIWLALVVHAVERVAAREWTPQHPHAVATIDAAWDAVSWRPIAPAPPAGDHLPTSN